MVEKMKQDCFAQWVHFVAEYGKFVLKLVSIFEVEIETEIAIETVVGIVTEVVTELEFEERLSQTVAV